MSEPGQELCSLLQSAADLEAVLVHPEGDDQTKRVSYSPLFMGSAKIAEGIKLGTRLIAEGKLSVPIAATYPLSSAAAALAHAQKGGKVLFKLS